MVYESDLIYLCNVKGNSDASNLPQKKTEAHSYTD